VVRPLLTDVHVIHHPARAFARGLTAIVVLGASACTANEDKLADHLETSVSWLAAIDVAGRGWLQNRLPVRFSRQLIDEGRSEVAASKRAIVDLPLGDVPAADAELAQAIASVDTLLASLERQDSTAVATALTVIAVHRSAIDSLANRVKPRSE
jgi:hypothetical protein